MEIVSVHVFGYNLRYAHGSYVMSGNRTIESLQSTVVRIESDEGLVGWGESCPSARPTSRPTRTAPRRRCSSSRPA